MEDVMWRGIRNTNYLNQQNVRQRRNDGQEYGKKELIQELHYVG
jgi:hypothetical protein